MVDLLASQSASGLFGEGNGPSAVLRTIAVLRTLAEQGIDSAHRQYGAQVKRAIEALVALVVSQAMEANLREPALAAVFLAASGARTRSLVTQAIDAHAPTLRAHLDDAPALRRVLASVPAL